MSLIRERRSAANTKRRFCEALVAFNPDPHPVRPGHRVSQEARAMRVKRCWAAVRVSGPAYEGAEVRLASLKALRAQVRFRPFDKMRMLA